MTILSIFLLSVLHQTHTTSHSFWTSCSLLLLFKRCSQCILLLWHHFLGVLLHKTGSGHDLRESGRINQQAFCVHSVFQAPGTDFAAKADTPNYARSTPSPAISFRRRVSPLLLLGLLKQHHTPFFLFDPSRHLLPVSPSLCLNDQSPPIPFIVGI